MSSNIGKRVGIFGGMFDPFHFGHMNLIVETLEHLKLDELIVIPANCSPSKMDVTPGASKEHRSKMVKLALDPLQRVSIDKMELHRDPPSYTIDTVLALKEKRPDDHFSLFVASDVAAKIDTWKDTKTLLQLVTLVVVSRNHHQFSKGGIMIPILEISSTTIRNRLANNLYCGHLMPAIVLDYIHTNKLYCRP